MSALSRVVRSGVSRRWVQTVVITLATAAAVTSGVLGVGLLVASNAPFDHAFAAQHGAHLTVLTDQAKATAEQLAATSEAAGVTEASGPFAVAQVMVLPGLPPGETEPPPGARGPVLTVAARTGPGTGVDQVSLTEGRWADGPGEVVLAAGGDFRVPVGDTLTMGQGPDIQEVTVVGLARSVSDTADAWMTPDGLATLPAESSGYQMLYRLDDAGHVVPGRRRAGRRRGRAPGRRGHQRAVVARGEEGGQQPDVVVRAVPADVRRSEPPAVRADRRHRRRRRGRLDDPPDRHPEGARLHPVPSGAGVRRPGAAARVGGGGAGCRRRQPGRGAAAGGHRGPLRHGRPDDRSLGGRRRSRRCARGGHASPRRPLRVAPGGSRPWTPSRSAGRRPPAAGGTPHGSRRDCRFPGR